MKNLVRRRKEHGLKEDHHNDISYLINPFATNSSAKEHMENGDCYEVNPEVRRQNREFQRRNISNVNPVAFLSSPSTSSMQIENNQEELVSNFFRSHSTEKNETCKNIFLEDDNHKMHIQNLRSQNTYSGPSLNDPMIISNIQAKNNGYNERKEETSIFSVPNRFGIFPIKSLTDSSYNLNVDNLIQPSIKNDFNKSSNSTFKQTNASFFQSIDSNEDLQYLRNRNIFDTEMNSQLIHEKTDQHLVRGQDKKMEQNDSLKNEVDLNQSLSLSINGMERKGCDESDLLNLGVNPIRTTSGLLLTHRQAPTLPYTDPFSNSRSVYKKQSNAQFNNQTHPYDPFGPSQATVSRKIQEPNKRFLHPSSQNNNTKTYGLEPGVMRNDRATNPIRRSGVTPFQMSIHKERGKKIQINLQSWILRFLAMLVLSTTISFVYFWRQNDHLSHIRQPAKLRNDNDNYQSRVTKSMLKVSLDTVNQSESKRIKREKPDELPTYSNTSTFIIGEIPKKNKRHRNLRELKEEFEGWILKHSKSYETEEEKETRFQNWMKNHHRTMKKNEKHGPCKLTGKPVFGSNHFKDLTDEEFKSRYLTGYKGPKVNHTSTKKHIHGRRAELSRIRPDRTQSEDPKVFNRFMNAWGRNYQSNLNFKGKTSGYSSSTTSWKNLFSACKGSMSCYLKFLFGGGYNREAAYDEDTFPESVDFRSAGAVTSIHKQGSCGACWGITAVETIESAYFLKTGELLDLAETEPILCDDSCEMCGGGWPQNAYEYAMDKGGLPLESSLSYDGDTLYLITMVLAGENDEVDGDYVTSYMNSICPDKGGGSGVERYAKPKGYGYATERCLCYTNGQGCDCDEQDEAQAIANLASFGPSTMCLDASVWMDYEGGIITPESGCSQYFMDMNHCVQVVGYAFLSSDEDEEEEEDDDDKSGSRSNSRNSGSRDFENREGYFIIRNQWSEYWGMNGYAYVAMGNGYRNTCGSLNDITQVYFD